MPRAPTVLEHGLPRWLATYSHTHLSQHIYYIPTGQKGKVAASQQKCEKYH
jgi:hypothetical protein